MIAKRSWRVSRNILLQRIPGDYVLEYEGIYSGKHVVNVFVVDSKPVIYIYYVASMTIPCRVDT